MDFQALTGFLEGLPDMGISGADCIVLWGHQTIYRHFCGCADKEEGAPMQGGERFYLYSCSKVITCVAALTLYEKGKFLLTDPLYEYIPEFKNMTVRVVKANGKEEVVPCRRKITVGDLFSMTAGFDYDVSVPEIQKVREETCGRAPTMEVIRALAGRPLVYEPGVHWRYGLCHDVLGALIEVLSGQRFGRYLREQIFEPLEMNRTGFPDSPLAREGMMVQYRRDEGSGKVERIPLEENELILGTEYESGGAGLISSVEDYARFASALANGGVAKNGVRILGKNTIDLMRTNRLNGRQMRDFDWDWLRGYGYGLGVRTLLDRAAAGSSGFPGEFGWSGAAGCYVLIDPECHLSMFYAQQMRNSLEPYVHPRLRNILYSCL